MPEWGRDIISKDVGGYCVRILSPRPTSLLAILEEARKWGARDFIVFDDRRIRFGEFIAASAAAAQRLAAHGVRRGDVVLLNAANSPEFLLAFWAALRCGAAVALANAWWSADEAAAAIGGLNPRLLVADAKRRALVEGHARFAGLQRLAIESLADCFGLGADAPFAFDGDEEAPGVFIFTSGTTGKSKAATLSHRALLACLHNIYEFRGVLPHELTPDDPAGSFFCCTPLFHVGGVLLQTQCLLSGHRLVILSGRADGGRILDLLERERVTVLSTVPAILSRILDYPDFAKHDLSSLRAISAAGAMVSPELLARVRAAFPQAGLATGSTYGMTESGGSVTMISGQDHIDRPSSAGRPFPTCELRINAPDASGEGEIFIRTPSAMSGYWGAPEDNMIDAQGWIHSGDLGRIDEDGFVHVTGRSKDIIIRGGENMSASVIEDRLCEHPDVLEAAVIGLPHAELGEEVAAAVVLRAGAEVEPSELAAFVAQKLAYFQTPTRWWLRDAPLPTNAVGKVFKPALRGAWPA